MKTIVCSILNNFQRPAEKQVFSLVLTNWKLIGLIDQYPLPTVSILLCLIYFWDFLYTNTHLVRQMSLSDGPLAKACTYQRSKSDPIILIHLLCFPIFLGDTNCQSLSRSFFVICSNHRHSFKTFCLISVSASTQWSYLCFFACLMWTHGLCPSLSLISVCYHRQIPTFATCRNKYSVDAVLNQAFVSNFNFWYRELFWSDTKFEQTSSR